MNWQLLLFAVIGMVVAFGIEVNKKGSRNMNWTSAALRYGLVFIVALALVYWINTQVVRTVLVSLAACGLALVAANNLGKNESR